MIARTFGTAMLCLAWLPATVAAGTCKYSDDRDVSIPVAGATAIEVIAGPGSLEVIGSTGATAVSADGRACADEEDALQKIEIITLREGDRIKVIAEIPPSTDDNWNGGMLHLRVEVPNNLPVTVRDSSGDLEVEKLASLNLRDSSGDLRIRDISGEVLIVSDSSGDVDIARVGDLVIEADSSGDIDIVNAASVRIDKDSSGGIFIRGVDGDVIIGSDSSGQIRVRDVGGDFTVENDSSGGINYDAVAGNVTLPEHLRDH